MPVAEQDVVVRRRRWLSFFPEGTIEFLVITRVLAVLMLLSLMIATGVQRPAILVALMGILWLDYVIMMWWVVGLGFDLPQLAGVPLEAPGEASGVPARGGERSWTAVRACLPSIAAFLGLAPWMMMLRYYRPGLNFSAWVNLVFGPGMVVVFILLAVPAWRSLRRLSVGSPVWAALLLVPGLHWLATHRVTRRLERRMYEHVRSSAGEAQAARFEGGSLAVPIADATWLLTALPWLVVAVLSVGYDAWPHRLPAMLLPFCGMLVGAVFAVANVAALEHTQKQFMALMRRPS